MQSNQELFLWLMLVLCILQTIFPGFFWFLSEGWKVRGDSEPSDAHLLLTRLGSILGIIIIGYMIYATRHPGASLFR